ncbi:MAG TPA: hypothetical protein VJH20_06070 [Candidatus Nanoarchaeia archaeon]|nr:hypothetical protein [Candidatus Nanoarchaeia archaeon]
MEPKDSKEVKEPAFNIPEEVKEKLKEIKTKLDLFKNKVLKDYKKSVIGISLLPPPPKAKDDKKEDEFHVFILAHEQDIKKVLEVRDKLIVDIEKLAQETDKRLKPQVMMVDELKEACFDAKYDLIQLIANSAILYDSADMLVAVKVAEIHKSMVIKKFEKYIVSYVAAGSLFRGEKSNDIDVYIVVDDTDVKKMSRFELRDKLRNIIIDMSFDAADIVGVKKQFHPQIYILTDFWESIKDANPVIFTFLRDGVPLYDRGTFMPWKLLLKMGRIRPSSEAIDMQMDIGEKLLDRAKKKLLGIAADDIYYSVLNPSQAVLMLYGVSPPTPKETVMLFEELLVKKEKLIEPKYVKILEKAVKTFKDIEHGNLKDISGKEIDLLIKEADDYLHRIQKVFEEIERRREKETIAETYETVLNIIKECLNFDKIKFTEVTLEKNFEDYIKKNKLPSFIFDVFKELKKAKKDYDLKKLTKAEAEKVKKDSRAMTRVMLEFIQRKKAFSLFRSKLRFKYGDTPGELYIFDKVIFIVENTKDKNSSIIKATIDADLNITKTEKSTKENLDDFVSKNLDSYKALSIKEKLFNSLKKIYGENIEIILD